MRIGFLGPHGTFSEEALGGSGAEGDRVPLATIREVVVAVERGDVDLALVPLENAIEGAVDPTLDALADAAPGTRVVGELVTRIRTCLVARDPAQDLTAIRAVLSHPQPLGQCAGFLREVLPQAIPRAASSTAEAVREVVATDAPLAALAPRAAAALHGGAVLREDVDDDPDNRTRFGWLARAGAGVVPPGRAGGAWRTSVLFAGEGDATPGWLVRCLSEFAFRGVNLTRIESRPLRATLGHYRFFIDLEGRDDERGPVAEAVRALGVHCDEVRVLGSYPRALPPA